MITVKVGTIPGTLKTVVLNDGATLREAFAAAEMQVGDFLIKKNGTTASLDSIATDGDLILLTAPIKGNVKTVKVGKVPGTITEVAVNDDATVEDVLETAGLEVGDFQIKKNSSVAELSDRVANGDLILLTAPIKGNN